LCRMSSGCLWLELKTEGCGQLELVDEAIQHAMEKMELHQK